MSYLQISFFLFIIFTSCSLKTTRGLLKQSKTVSVFNNSYFSNTKKDYIYKAKIDIYGNYFGGIIIFKKIKNEHHRIVFTTEFGTKIFDFEIIANYLKKNYIIEKLNKKLIINTLENDFRLLLKEENNIKATFGNNNYVLYQSEFNNNIKFFKVNKTNKQLKKIIYTSKYKEKVHILFGYTKNDVANDITISHKNIKLNIHLKSIM